MILSYLVAIAVPGAFLLWMRRLKNNTKNNIYRIGHISDNMGRSFYKIVAKRNITDKEFLEFENFPVIKLDRAPNQIKEYALRAWRSKEEAELDLERFKIIIGQVEYVKKIKV